MPQAPVVFCIVGCNSRNLHCPECRGRKACTATSPGSTVRPAPETQWATLSMMRRCTTCLTADAFGCFVSTMGLPAPGLQLPIPWHRSWDSTKKNLHGSDFCIVCPRFDYSSSTQNLANRFGTCRQLVFV